MHRTPPAALAHKLGLGLLLVGLLVGLGWWRGGPRRRPDDPLAGWQIEALVAHLQDKGLEVRAVPTYKHGPVNAGAFLTTTDHNWERLNGLHAIPECIGEWDGTVFCSPATGDAEVDIRLWLWRDYGERKGPFLLFGDPTLRARISDALRDAPARPRATPPGNLTPVKPTAVAD
jgi:hypothetical protein